MAAVNVPFSKLRLLKQLQCSIFQTAYNPSSTRTGAKYLRARLRGPSMVGYYPRPEEHSIAALNNIYPGWNLVDTDEVVRLNDIEERKKRGKGAPKKAYSEKQSRRTARKR